MPGECEYIDPSFLTAFVSLEFQVEIENTLLFVTFHCI